VGLWVHPNLSRLAESPVHSQSELFVISKKLSSPTTVTVGHASDFPDVPWPADVDKTRIGPDRTGSTFVDVASQQTKHILTDKINSVAI